MGDFSLIQLSNHSDSRGGLIVAEAGKTIPFEFKRIFYQFNVPAGAIRGQHANRYSKFAFITLAGSCKILLDDGNSKQTFSLTTPDVALYVNKMVWKEMFDFSPDAVLCVLSDQFYSAEDYINSQPEFHKLKGGF